MRINEAETNGQRDWCIPSSAKMSGDLENK